MQTFKRGIVVAALLFSPTTLTQDLNLQLTAWFSQCLAGFNDEVVVTIRTSPNLLPNCEQPALSVSGNAKLWGNVNVLVCCANEKRYSQVNVQAMRNYAIAVASVARGSTLALASVTLKRDRLDQPLPCTVLDMSQVQDVASLRDLVPGQPIQLSMLRQAWRIKTGRRVLIIANGGGLRVNAGGKALNNAAVAQNTQMRMISGQVVSGVADFDRNILINL